MKHAIELLTRQIETSEHNAGVQGNEGRYDDEALSLAVAADCRAALAVVERHDAESSTGGE